MRGHIRYANAALEKLTGDEALQKVLRAGDFIARIGGEGFGLLFKGADTGQARQVTERLRLAFRFA